MSKTLMSNGIITERLLVIVLVLFTVVHVRGLRLDHISKLIDVLGQGRHLLRIHVHIGGNINFIMSMIESKNILRGCSEKLGGGS